MLRGDGLYLWFRETADDNDPERWYKIGVFNHQQGDSSEMFPTEPFNFQHDWNFYIEQWAGTAGRAYEWSIRAP